MSDQLSRMKEARGELAAAMILPDGSPDRHLRVAAARRTLSALYTGLVRQGLSDTDEYMLLWWASLDAGEALVLLADRAGVS